MSKNKLSKLITEFNKYYDQLRTILIEEYSICQIFHSKVYVHFLWPQISNNFKQVSNTNDFYFSPFLPLEIVQGIGNVNTSSILYAKQRFHSSTFFARVSNERSKVRCVSLPFGARVPKKVSIASKTIVRRSAGYVYRESISMGEKKNSIVGCRLIFFKEEKSR